MVSRLVLVGVFDCRISQNSGLSDEVHEAQNDQHANLSHPAHQKRIQAHPKRIQTSKCCMVDLSMPPSWKFYRYIMESFNQVPLAPFLSVRLCCRTNLWSNRKKMKRPPSHRHLGNLSPCPIIENWTTPTTIRSTTGTLFFRPKHCERWCMICPGCIAHTNTWKDFLRCSTTPEKQAKNAES